MLSFSGRHYPTFTMCRLGIILQCVSWYVSYSLNYRNIEEMMKERGFEVDHATINRWVVEYAPLLEEKSRKYKREVHSSWRMDETYIKIKGKWRYLYRAVDKYGDSHGGVSNQIDLIIYDRQYSPFIFQDRAKGYIPAESVYAVFEIKQVLNKAHVEYAQNKAQSVRKLVRTSLPIPNIYGASKPKEPHFIHAGLLCFNSDWSPPFGDSFEKVLVAGVDGKEINQVCVAQDGYFEIDDDKQIYHGSTASNLFFYAIGIYSTAKGNRSNGGCYGLCWVA